MNESELIDFLKKNLEIKVKVKTIVEGEDIEVYVRTALKLDGDEISFDEDKDNDYISSSSY
jgi:hypothetical protein